MERLPPPPSVPLPATVDLSLGRLRQGWRIVFGLSWGAIFLSFAAVWEASRQLGLPTWWLGPTSHPRPVLVQLLPFLLPGAAVACAAWNTRRCPLVGIAAALATTAIALGDMGSVGRLALVEASLALSGMAVSVAALSGVAGPRPGVDADDVDDVDNVDNVDEEPALPAG